MQQLISQRGDMIGVQCEAFYQSRETRDLSGQSVIPFRHKRPKALVYFGFNSDNDRTRNPY